MPVQLEAFLSLEDTMAQRLSATFTKVTAPVLAEVQVAVNEKRWADAITRVQSIDLQKVVDANLPAIQYLSQMSVMFGASRVTNTPGTSRVGLGFETETIQQVVMAFSRAITVSIRNQLIQTALQLIAIERAKDSPKADSAGTYLGRVLKAGKEPALLPFESFVGKQGKALFKTASSLHTSRLAAFGFTSEAKYLGITRYKITEQLDARTCPVCAMMHGKTFDVEDARSLLDIVIRTQDPDELKGLQPWPNQSKQALTDMAKMSQSELVQRGWHVPPFHPRCRGLLDSSRQKKVLPAALTAAPESDEGYQATPEEFEQYGLKFSPAKIKIWNSVMQSPVSEVLAKLTGKAPEQVLVDSLSDVGSGIKHLSATSTGVNLELKTKVGGSNVTQDLYFKADQSLYIGSIDLGSGSVDTFRQVMSGIYKVAKTTTMKRLKMVAGGASEGWAWAKYGLSPSTNGWKKLTAMIKASPEKMQLIAKASATESKAAMLALNSTDPQDIFVLADLPKIGKKLLADTQWEGILELDNAEAVTRFLATAGAA